MTMPTPHLEKLNAALLNPKLPASDKPRIEQAIERYHEWVGGLARSCREPEDPLSHLLTRLDEYKRHIDLEVIFDSPNDFLYRQKGQLKLDNSVIEEFLPWLFRSNMVPDLLDDLEIGPTRCFFALYFQSCLADPGFAGNPRIRGKDQDFAISRRIYVRTSYDRTFADFDAQESCIAYVAAEIKTNLDKTMFQEACATAHDVKSAVPGSRYFLLCEWLDMTPLSTASTDIDEVLILRAAKRLPSNVRQHYGNYAGRQEGRADYVRYLTENPFQYDVFARLVDHVKALLSDRDPLESDALERGYF